MLNRKKIRLKDYDYSQAGCYFITICTQNGINQFGKIINGEMILNQWGLIIFNKWKWLEEQYPYAFLDEFVVMPNHFHAIIAIIEEDMRNGHDHSLQKIKSISSLVGAFKTTSSKQIHIEGNIDFKWQKSFYDRVIRNEKEFENIQAYIHYNPLRWALDIENKMNDGRNREKYYQNVITGKNI